MHAILFSIKRAFHTSVCVGRNWLTPLGLTPARFDMLAAIGRHPPHRMPQSALRDILGVTNATISRMLRSLEDLGLVTREQDFYDQRRRIISLTKRGIRRLRCAVTNFIDSGAVQLAIDIALSARWHNRDACLAAGTRFEASLRRLRRDFGDNAMLSYPWRPDERPTRLMSSIW
jgi:DNA-binding MarR family transcriptional regulator